MQALLEDGQAAEQVGDAEEYRLGDERSQQGVEAFLEDHADGEQGCGDPELVFGTEQGGLRFAAFRKRFVFVHLGEQGARFDGVRKADHRREFGLFAFDAQPGAVEVDGGGFHAGEARNGVFDPGGAPGATEIVYGVALSHGFPLLAARFRSAGRANALQGNGSNRTLRARSRRLLRRAGFPRYGLHPR